MEGSPGIVELPNEVLTAELTAINQYFVQAKMCDNSGYARLAQRLREESIDEMRDAEALIVRILCLGVPNLQRYGPVMVGETVPQQHQMNLDLERAAIERLNRGITECRSAGDEGTGQVLERTWPARSNTPIGSRPSWHSSTPSASLFTWPSRCTQSLLRAAAVVDLPTAHACTGTGSPAAERHTPGAQHEL